MADDGVWAKTMTRLGLRGFAGKVDPELNEQVAEFGARLAEIERRLSALEGGDGGAIGDSE